MRTRALVLATVINAVLDRGEVAPADPVTIINGDYPKRNPDVRARLTSRRLRSIVIPVSNRFLFEHRRAAAWVLSYRGVST